MKFAIVPSIATALMLSAAPSASAQLGQVAGDLTGQLDVTGDLGAATGLIDTRTGLQLDTRLVSRLDAGLGAYDAAYADARLRSALETEARAYSRTQVSAPRASARSSTRIGADARHEPRYARVYVYSSDGYRVGHVDRYRSGRVYVYSDLDGAPRHRVAVRSADAAFASRAHAVVLSSTRAEFAGQVRAAAQTH